MPYVDVAIMAPVPPKGIKTHFLASGPAAQKMLAFFESLGLDFTFLSEHVGDASTRKLLRSIVYKGVAAVICEAVEAGKAFGLEDYIREQIHTVIGGNNSLIDRFIEVSYHHAESQVHEMEEIVQMQEKKDIQPIMSATANDNLEKICNAFKK